MEAERELVIMLKVKEKEAKLILTGLDYGCMYIKDNINPPDDPEKPKRLITGINEISSVIRKSLMVYT